MAKSVTNEKLLEWQKKFNTNKVRYEAELTRMEEREELYRGGRALKPLTEKDTGPDGGVQKTPHVRNIIAENIESQINSAIPMPKVTARRKKDEPLAKLIEDMIRNELNRLPFEYLNDLQERTVPLQGGSFYHVEWDNTKGSHTTVGEVDISARHPRQVIPQDGVYTAVEDMDYVFLELPTTKESIKRIYNVDVSEESEDSPEIRGGDGTPADDMVTQIMALYRNSKGGIGLYTWVRETELADIEDYQARRLPRCKVCGQLQPVDGTEVVEKQEMILPDAMSAALGVMPEMVEKTREWHKGDACPHCGGREWESKEETHQEIWDPIVRTVDGKTVVIVPSASEQYDPETGLVTVVPTKVPYFKPDMYPVVLQRNVSIFGQLLGDSDADKIEDQQNTINRLEKKDIDRLVKAGSRILMPGQARHRVDPKDGELWYVDNMQDMSMIQVKDFTGNLQYELAYLAQVYEESRQAIGITDSFQGREDTTAKSGVAKQFAAAQSAGRMESKRVMKDAAYAELFRLIFLFRLAYADEPRPVVSQDSKGNTTYAEFNKWDFLERDADGVYYWNTDFLFSTDTSAPLAANRERMWQETINLFSAGCFGNPQELETLVALWTKLELLHYPGAGDTRDYLEEKLQQQMAAQQQAMQQQAMQQQAMQQQMAQAGQMRRPMGGQRQQMEAMAQKRALDDVGREVMSAVDRRAKADAVRDYMSKKQQ